MRHFNFVIQIQPNNTTSFLKYKEELEFWARETKFIKSFLVEDNLSAKEAYWNLQLLTDNIQETYNSLKPIIESKSNTSDHTIRIVVACENDDWNDYQELYNNATQIKS